MVPTVSERIRNATWRIAYERRWAALVPLFISLIIYATLTFFGMRFPRIIGGDAGFIALTWLGGFLGTNIPLFRTLFGPLGRILLKIDGLAKPPGREEIVNFVKENLGKLERDLAGVLSTGGTPMDKAALERFTTICFWEGKGIYNGVESHLPSEFYTLYSKYLSAHEVNLTKNPNKESSRILLASRTDLREDYLRNRNRYEEFFHWHEEHKVALLHIHPRVAQKLINELNIPTTDLGIWEDQYVLLFGPKSNGEVVLSMVPKGVSMFDRCMNYFYRLKSCVIDKVTDPPELVDRNLADRWEEYVNVDDRHKVLEPFLTTILEHYSGDEILDAAAGIGCESVCLLKNSFRVRPNELEKNFRDVADSYFKKHGCRIKLDGYNWLELTKEYGTDRFGAVLVLGNCLCLLLNESERENAVRRFWEILKPGGMLVIDERNFDHMLRNREHILENPLKNYNFGQSMYCGKTVKGCPIDITPEKVTWACYSNDQEVSNWETLNQCIIGEFELYPFKKGELFRLLSDVGGFVNIQCYSNLQLGDNPEAEFFTYTAIKRLEKHADHSTYP